MYDGLHEVHRGSKVKAVLVPAPITNAVQRRLVIVVMTRLDEEVLLVLLNVLAFVWRCCDVSNEHGRILKLVDCGRHNAKTSDFRPRPRHTTRSRRRKHHNHMSK